MDIEPAPLVELCYCSNDFSLNTGNPNTLSVMKINVLLFACSHLEVMKNSTIHFISKLLVYMKLNSQL